MPVSTSSMASTVNDADTYSLMSQISMATTIGDSLPDQLVRKTARKGFTFNIMSVGPSDMNKTTLLSALFGKNLEITRELSNQTDLSSGTNPTTSAHEGRNRCDTLNPPVSVVTKTFEIEEKRVRLKLTVAESEYYGEALCLKGTHQPLVDYIDTQFADYHRRESSYDRRTIKDKMIHCLFFFISPYGHGLSALDIEFLKATHDRVNIIPIIARSETLTITERALFKRRVKDDLKRNNILIYQMSRPDLDDRDDMKKLFKDIQDAMPFAISSMNLRPDNTPMPRSLDWGQIDPNNLEHSDFPLLKSMLHLQIPDLCELTHEVFYEEFRLKKMDQEMNPLKGGDGPTRARPNFIARE